MVPDPRPHTQNDLSQETAALDETHSGEPRTGAALQARSERDLTRTVKRELVDRIVTCKIRNFDQLQRTASAALGVLERLTSAKHHLARRMNDIVFGVSANATAEFFTTFFVHQPQLIRPVISRILLEICKLL